MTSPVKGVLRKLAFSFVPMAVVIGGVEMGLRATGWPTPTAAFEHNEPFWITESNLVQQTIAHNEVSGTFKISSNGDGLRAPIHSREKPPGEWRLMMLGCSTTFGWGVDDAHSFPAQLEQLSRASGHENVSVINGGQPGYTSFQGLWLWREALSAYSPDVVVIGYVVQDARRAAYSDKSQAVLQQDGRFLKDNVLYKSRVYLGLRDLIGGVQIKAKERPSGGIDGVYRVPPADYADNLRALVAGVKAVGAVPILFGFPLEREGYTALHRRILKAAASELRIRYIDMQVAMNQLSRDEQLYFEKDRGHANTAGNQQIAQSMFDYLIGQSLMGAP
jgi:lysophospholipase L1-like esterase